MDIKKFGSQFPSVRPKAPLYYPSTMYKPRTYVYPCHNWRWRWIIQLSLSVNRISIVELISVNFIVLFYSWGRLSNGPWLLHALLSPSSDNTSPLSKLWHMALFESLVTPVAAAVCVNNGGHWQTTWTLVMKNIWPNSMGSFKHWW